tara:strand:+ start:164 stop:2080 length:1917 start_codon:yes stop_codon:yes gene_type:complete
MPFKSEKQRKWMYANKPEMAKKWSKKEQKLKREMRVKHLIKKMVREHGLHETSPAEYKAQANELDMLRKIADLEMKALSIKTGGGIPGHQSLEDKEALVKSFSKNPEASLVDLHTQASDLESDDTINDKTSGNDISSLLPALGLGGLGVAGLAAAKNKKDEKEKEMKNEKISEQSKLANLPKTNKFAKSIPDTYTAPSDRTSIQTGGRGYKLTGNPDGFVKPTQFGKLPDRPLPKASPPKGKVDMTGFKKAAERALPPKLKLDKPISQKELQTRMDKIPVGLPRDDKGKIKIKPLTTPDSIKKSLSPKNIKKIGENLMNKNLFKEDETKELDVDQQKKLDKIGDALQWVDDHKKELGVAGLVGGGYLLNRHLKKKRKKKNQESVNRGTKMNEKKTQITQKNFGNPVVTKFDDTGKQTDQYPINVSSMGNRQMVGTDISKYTKGKKGFLGIGKEEPKLIGDPKYQFGRVVKVAKDTPGLNNPDGPRYYQGTATSRDRYGRGFGNQKAEMDAYMKIANNPADSLSYDQYSKMPFFKKNENLNRDVRNLISEQIAVNENTRAMLAEKGLLKKLAKGALMLGLGAALHKGYQDKKLGFLQKPAEKAVDFFKGIGKKAPKPGGDDNQNTDFEDSSKAALDKDK